MKKSKFIAHAWPCSSAEEAARLIDSRRDPSASHNCWAYKVGVRAGRSRLASLGRGRGQRRVCMAEAGRAEPFLVPLLPQQL